MSSLPRASSAPSRPHPGGHHPPTFPQKPLGEG
jgi:hypothetical protein